MEIHNCKGCLKAGRDSKSPCSQKDDMEQIYAEFEDADVIVFAYRNRHGGASELAEKFCHECGIAPSYIFVSDYCIYPRSQADDLQGDGYRS